MSVGFVVVFSAFALSLASSIFSLTDSILSYIICIYIVMRKNYSNYNTTTQTSTIKKKHKHDHTKFTVNSYSVYINLTKLKILFLNHQIQVVILVNLGFLTCGVGLLIHLFFYVVDLLLLY